MKIDKLRQSQVDEKIHKEKITCKVVKNNKPQVEGKIICVSLLVVINEV